MNEKLLVGIGVGVVCVGLWLSSAVQAQNVTNQSAAKTRTTIKTRSGISGQKKPEPMKPQVPSNLADTLYRHCGNCNQLAMFRNETPWDPVYTKVKTSEDTEFEARIRQNFLDNYLAGNIRGPFHKSEGVCICGHAHDLNTQIAVNNTRLRVEAAAALYNLEMAAKQREQQQADPSYKSDELVQELRKANELKAESERQASKRRDEDREQRRVDSIEDKRSEERFLRTLEESGGRTRR